MAEPRITVAAPARQARLGGLLSVVDVIDNVKFLAASTNAQFVEEPCSVEFNDAGFCYSFAPGDNPKTYTGIDKDGVSVVPNFAGYYGVECFISNDTDFDRRAREALAAVESRYVESKFFAWLDAAVAVTATNLEAAIAKAENDADAAYIGRPIIHMNRGDAVIARAADLIFNDEQGNLWTVNGTPVVASSAYTAGSIWVTGSITVLRSPLVETTSEALQDNLAQAIAERVYGIIVDCAYRAEIDFTA